MSIRTIELLVVSHLLFFFQFLQTTPPSPILEHLAALHFQLRLERLLLLLLPILFLLLQTQRVDCRLRRIAVSLRHNSVLFVWRRTGSAG